MKNFNTIMHLKELITEIIMKFTNCNEVNENYGQEWNLQRVLKSTSKYAISISAFLKENILSSVMLPF